MIDLSVLIADLCDGLGDDTGPVFPVFPGSFPGKPKQHVIDNNEISRSFRYSRSMIGTAKSEHEEDARNVDFSSSAHARASSHNEAPGNTGKQEKSLAETTPPPFPVKLSEPGKPGNQEPVAGAFPPIADPIPISAADVRAGVARELRSLAEDGRESPTALRDAVEITRAKIRNSEALAERQAHGGRCHVCDAPLDDSAPVVAVLSGRRGAPLYLHAACCDAYTTRRITLVDRIMAEAGYGALGTLEVCA